MRYLLCILCICGCSEKKIDSPALIYYCDEYYTAADGITGLNCKLYKDNEPLFRQKSVPYVIIRNKESYGK